MEETKNELITLDQMGREVRKITKFEQTVEDLKAIVANAQKITVDNIEDKEQLVLAKSTRIELRNIEIAIEKRGKGYRDVFNAVNKEILNKERELKKITAPEIERLTAIEEEAKEIAIRKARIEAIPARQERLKEIGIEATDEELMEFDDDAFKVFVNEKIEEKNEQERQRIETEKAKMEKERLAMEREKEMREREEKAREEERLKAERIAKEKEKERIGEEKRRKIEAELEAKQKIEEAKAEAEQIKREAKEKVEREEREKKEKEEAERKARKELEKKKKYQDWLKKGGWTEETKDEFFIQDHGHIVELYKLVGTYNK